MVNGNVKDVNIDCCIIFQVIDMHVNAVDIILENLLAHT